MPTDNLIGTWTCLAATVDGKALPKDTTDLLSLTLTENRYKTEKGSQVLFDSSYTIDPSANPRQINMVGTEGDLAGKEAPGIFSLEEDVLRICYVMPGLPVRRSFKASPVQKPSWFCGNESHYNGLETRDYRFKRRSIFVAGWQGWCPRLDLHQHCARFKCAVSALDYVGHKEWGDGLLEWWISGYKQWLGCSNPSLQSKMVPREGFPPPTSPF